MSVSGAIVYLGLIGGFFVLAMGLYFGLRAVKLI